MTDAEGAFDIAASGMAAQRMQMDIIADNLANANTLRAGAPFRARAAVFETASPFAQALEVASLGSSPFGSPSFDEFALSLEDESPPGGVRFAGLIDSREAPAYRYDPGNPFAATDGPRKGYVEEPAVDAVTQMVGLVASGRAYDANVAVLQAAKQMEIEAADIERT